MLSPMPFPWCSSSIVNQVVLHHGFEKLDAFFCSTYVCKELLLSITFLENCRNGTKSMAHGKVYRLLWFSILLRQYYWVFICEIFWRHSIFILNIISYRAQNISLPLLPYKLFGWLNFQICSSLFGLCS